MTVYLVSIGEYEDEYVQGVYSTLEKAMAVLNEYRNRPEAELKYGDYPVDIGRAEVDGKVELKYGGVRWLFCWPGPGNPLQDRVTGKTVEQPSEACRSLIEKMKTLSAKDVIEAFGRIPRAPQNTR